MENNDSLSPASLSQLLRSKRVEQKLTFDQVADKLKLPVTKIEQLESKSSLAELDPFDRGHLRNYAALLGVDLKPFEPSSDEAQKMSAELKSVEQKGLNVNAPENSRRLFLALAFIILLIVGYFLVTQVIDMGQQVGGILPEMSTENLRLDSPSLPSESRRPQD